MTSRNAGISSARCLPYHGPSRSASVATCTTRSARSSWGQRTSRGHWRRSWPPSTRHLPPKAAKIAELVSNSLRQARRLSRGLSPVDMAAGGLVAGLEDLARATREMSGITCRVTVGAGVTMPCQTTAVHLYQLAREAIANAMRHGKARNIDIAFGTAEAEGAQLVVRGTTASGGSRSPRTAGPGPAADAIQDGHRRRRGSPCDTPPGRGTSVTCLFPLESVDGHRRGWNENMVPSGRGSRGSRPGRRRVGSGGRRRG